MNNVAIKAAEFFVDNSTTSQGDMLISFLDDGVMIVEEIDVLVIDLEDGIGGA